jgi:hypothetical protein
MRLALLVPSTPGVKAASATHDKHHTDRSKSVTPYGPTKEAIAILDRLLVALMIGMPVSGSAGSNLRTLVGKLHDTADVSIETGTIGTDLQACFDAALAAGARLTNMDNVRIAMLKETPKYFIGAAIACAGIAFTLVEQTRMITAMAFASQVDVQAMITRMSAIFDEVKLAMGNLITGNNYQYIVGLNAALIQHLAATERQLPRVVSYLLASNLPSLAIANLLYADASRSDEIIKENGVVHPAFCPRNILALSQ